MSGWVYSKNASSSAPLATMELQFITAIFVLWTGGFSVLGGALGEEEASGESRLVVLGPGSRLVFTWE